MTVYKFCVCTKVCVLLSIWSFISTVHAAQFPSGIQNDFYSLSCPQAESLVASTVSAHMNGDASVAAGLLRLLFHDCFVQGCDASVLIDGPSAEKTAFANAGLRGFEVIDDAKSQIEAICPGVVSCADILAFAARDAVAQSGGSTWQVPAGRRDGFVSSASNVLLPSSRDTASALKQSFAAKGLSTQDLVTLSGAHTLGTTACLFFTFRLYNFTATGGADPAINKGYLRQLEAMCRPDGDGVARVALDKGSEFDFDTSYYSNLQAGNAVLLSDQSLMQDSSTQAYVNAYTGLLGSVLGSFSSNFANSMVKMSLIDVITGSDGEIRDVCSAVNQG